MTTEDGVEDQTIDWHLDGGDLVVANDADEKRVLGFVNEAFELRLDNAELAAVLKAGLDHRLEALRQEAIAAADDDARLDVYFGPDDLREALPSGLWQALEAQGLVDDDTSVAELFRTVYGSDSVKQLQENFRQLGFPDVPTTWAGGASTISWLRKMGFGTEYAGRRDERTGRRVRGPRRGQAEPAAHVPAGHQRGAARRSSLAQTPTVAPGRRWSSCPPARARRASPRETVLRLFIEGKLRGPVLWIAQSQELCEQAVQTWSSVWRGLGDERPLTIGRLWESNTVHEPDTEFSVVVATDAKLNVILGKRRVRMAERGDARHHRRRPPGWRLADVHEDPAMAGRCGHADGRGHWSGLSATPFKGTSESATRRSRVGSGTESSRRSRATPITSSPSSAFWRV